MKDETVKNISEEIYETLKGRGIEVLLDDRDERCGVKFKDMDLVGIPVRITVGKKAGEGIVEFKIRGEEGFAEMKIDEAIETAVSKVMEGLK